jgi:hypothetical protein
MNNFQILILKSLRKVYQRIIVFKHQKVPECIQDADIASNIIYETLILDKPCMIARFGSTELACLMNYIGVTKEKNKFFSYFQGKTPPWWWEQKIIDQMQNWSGFFPPTINTAEQFCQLMLNDIPQVDILGSWLVGEAQFDHLIGKSIKVNFELLNPYFSKTPWTKVLEGKKVLVIHPFAKTIQSQYKYRHLIFKNNLLPHFELQTIQSVQSLANNKTNFIDWFEALDSMKSEIDKYDYDICLIGCGAYGFPLAAHVKRQGKKAIHMGGSLQLLFGIKGKRWENPNYNPIYNYSQLMNEHWVYPSNEEKPQNSNSVEGGCYW